MKHPFKTAGIPRTGFEYQDLIGIEVLLRFYRDPSLYLWVALEADEPQVGKLDDVVAARRDNSFELLQVKFTPDPGTYFLDWEWLLERKGRGTSLLQKWADALIKVREFGSVHSAKLRTNRRPSPDFQKSLVGNHVDFEIIDYAVKKLLTAQLGSELAAREFFASFEFAHSERLVDDLEKHLKGKVVPTDTDNAGWLLLRDQARRWATRRDSPEPDGKIRHNHLVQIITKHRPQPIPQDFAVPPLYQVPSKAFDDHLMNRIKNGSRQVSVIWGSPGRGKSTYLSHVVKSLQDSDFAAVRHHYFLALDDSTIDRVSFAEIATSLMQQIAGLYPEAVQGMEDVPDKLRDWIERCGAYFLSLNKRFFLIIDGLDHVWREQQNTSQMEHLFNYLLPCPENVFLLVGTQKVPTTQLPLRLVQQAEDVDWIEVPAMDESAVHSWLAGQQGVGRLLLREENLNEVSKAFHAISKGNPLHLIYSFESLVRRGISVTAEDVFLLPSCPDGDIRNYYRRLFARLSPAGRKVLHVVAGSDFHWPPDGLRRCAGSLDEVDHLLEHRRTGLIPFHGSILAYAREEHDYRSIFQSALPDIIDWLEFQAPEYWRWAWLWIMRGQMGDVDPLVSGTTRDWVVQSLVRGWPATQIEAILDAAEYAAFGMNDYVRTSELRSLNVRLQNMGFQIQRAHDFQEVVVRVAGNEQQILNMADSLQSATDNDIITLVRCLDGEDLDGIAGDCFDELRRRVNLWIKLQHRTDQEFFSLVGNFIEAIVEYGDFDPQKLLHFVSQFHERDKVYETVLRQVVRTNNLDIALSIIAHLTGAEHTAWRCATEETMVEIASREGIDLTLRYTPTADISPLLSCWYRLNGYVPPKPVSLVNLSPAAIASDYDYGRNTIVERFLYTFFFLALDSALVAEGDCRPLLPGIDRSKMGWLQEAISHLWNSAFEVAANVAELGFDSVFLGLADLAPIEIGHQPTDPSSAQYRALRWVVGDIAIGLHALACARLGASPIQPDSFAVARRSKHWVDSIWIEKELLARRRWIDPTAIAALIGDIALAQATSVTQFNERAETWIDVSLLAVLYDLDGAEGYAQRAAECILGYGWRKDVWIFDVLASVESVRQAGVADVRPWIEKLAPVIDQITVFTDGDETNHSPKELVSLIANARPEWLPLIYAEYIAAEEYDLAEHTLAAVVEMLSFHDAPATALLKSLVERSDLDVLEKLKEAGVPGASQAVKERDQFLGVMRSSRKASVKTSDPRRINSGEDLGKRGRPPDIRKFAPHNLEALLRRVDRPKLGYQRRDASLRRWLKYWSDEGQGLEALKAVDDYYCSHDNPREVVPLLDEAFQVSLRYQGKKKAYKWLVRAHIERHGWSYYWTDRAENRRRLELAAFHYKEQWSEFIHDTSKPGRYWESKRTSLTLGTRRLVEFLLLVEQTELAIKLALSMVQRLLEEVRDQPIPKCSWLP